MDVSNKSRKEVGRLGESIAAAYLVRHGCTIVDRNVARKTGELDIIARSEHSLHFVEVKTSLTESFPSSRPTGDDYDPSFNLHAYKIKKVARTAEWYVLEKGWEGEWQVDGCLVWLRRKDGHAYVRYFSQIL